MFNRLYQSVISDRQTNGDLFEEFASQYFDMRLQEEASKGPARKKQRVQKIVVMNDLWTLVKLSMTKTLCLVLKRSLSGRVVNQRLQQQMHDAVNTKEQVGNY